jgi:non-ribosomal peptide synthase protein (TIGR01720 family)
MFRAARESSGPNSSRRGLRSHLLEINSMVAGDRLRVNWAYSENVHRRANVEALAGSYMEALRDLVEHCASAEAGGFTPSDFPDADLSQKSLDRLMSRLSRVSVTEA